MKKLFLFFMLIVCLSLTGSLGIFSLFILFSNDLQTPSFLVFLFAVIIYLGTSFGAIISLFINIWKNN